MARVIQVRDVPDEVRDALAQAAAREGLSMSGYVRRELEHLAQRAQRAQDNAAVIHRTQRQVLGRVDRASVLAVLHEGRQG